MVLLFGEQTEECSTVTRKRSMSVSSGSSGNCSATKMHKSTSDIFVTDNSDNYSNKTNVAEETLINDVKIKPFLSVFMEDPSVDIEGRRSKENVQGSYYTDSTCLYSAIGKLNMIIKRNKINII